MKIVLYYLNNLEIDVIANGVSSSNKLRKFYLLSLIDLLFFPLNVLFA